MPTPFSGLGLGDVSPQPQNDKVQQIRCLCCDRARWCSCIVGELDIRRLYLRSYDLITPQKMQRDSRMECQSDHEALST